MDKPLAWLNRYKTIEIVFILFFVTYLTLVALELWQPAYSFLPPKIDFEVYWAGGKKVIRGAALYADDSVTPLTGERLGFTYPPAAALFFTLFAWLPLKLSIFLWVLLTMLALLVIIYILLVKMLDIKNNLIPLSMLFFMLAMLIGPVRETFNFGQINLLLMLLVCVDFLVVPPKYKGFLLGIAIALKLTPAALLLGLMLGKKYRIILNTILSALCCSLISFIFLFDESKKFWGQVFSTNRIGRVNNPSNQSINGFLARISSTGTPNKKVWLVLCLIAVILVSLLIIRLLQANNYALAFITNTLLMLLVSPISWSHHWVWCIPALLYMLFNLPKNLLTFSWLVVGIIVFYVMPQFILPKAGAYNHTWSWYEQILGNSFTMWAVGFILIVSFLSSKRRKSIRI